MSVRELVAGVVCPILCSLLTVRGIDSGDWAVTTGVITLTICVFYLMATEQ